MGTFASLLSQSPARVGMLVPKGEAHHGATDGREASSLEASGINIVWEVVIFHFLFCFKKKHITKKENFFNENVIAWRQGHNLQQGAFRRWREPLPLGTDGLWPWLSVLLHCEKCHP